MQSHREYPLRGRRFRCASRDTRDCLSSFCLFAYRTRQCRDSEFPKDEDAKRTISGETAASGFRLPALLLSILTNYLDRFVGGAAAGKIFLRGRKGSRRGGKTERERERERSARVESGIVSVHCFLNKRRPRCFVRRYYVQPDRQDEREMDCCQFYSS